VHYLYEVKRGGEPIRNPVKFLLFAIFFPSLVAGPIKRYTQFLPSLEAGVQRLHWENIAWGLGRVGQGFFKKLLIADNLTFLIDFYQPQFASLSLVSRWGVFAAIAFRILMDFFRLQRHRDRLRPVARGPAAGKLQLAVCRSQHPGFLAALAHFAQHVDSRLCLYSTRRQPPRSRAAGVQRAGGLRPVRPVARAGLAFRDLGLYHGVGLMVCATYRQVPGLGPAVQKIFAKEPLSAWLLTQVFAWFGWLVFFYPLPEALRMAGLLFGS